MLESQNKETKKWQYEKWSKQNASDKKLEAFLEPSLEYLCRMLTSATFILKTIRDEGDE
jgi:hypothetical protein